MTKDSVESVYENPNPLRPLQTVEDGVGSVFHRRYHVLIHEPRYDQRQMMDLLKENPNQFSPQTIARFHKSKGHPKELAIGDEYDIALKGPWNAPVWVSEVSDVHIKLTTLEGHPEAGEIIFRLEQKIANEFDFCIESWARSHNLMVNLLYDTLPLVRLVQTHMWVMFCEAFAQETTGHTSDHIDVLTERFDPGTGQWHQE